MTWKESSIPGTFLRLFDKHADERGTFFEIFREYSFSQDVNFVQDSISVSRGPVLRGMHSQLNQWQLTSVIHGTAIDILCDLRQVKTGKVLIQKIHLGEEFDQILIPPGVAHGFCSLSDILILNYKTSEYYDSSKEFNFHWQSFNLQEFWPNNIDFIISAKDKNLDKLDFK